MIEYMACCTNIKYQADHVSETLKTAYVYSCDGQNHGNIEKNLTDKRTSVDFNEKQPKYQNRNFLLKAVAMKFV